MLTLLLIWTLPLLALALLCAAGIATLILRGPRRQPAPARQAVSMDDLVRAHGGEGL